MMFFVFSVSGVCKVIKSRFSMPTPCSPVRQPPTSTQSLSTSAPKASQISKSDFLSQHKGNITFEITPQHLTIYAPDCYDKLGTYAQMNPPLRDKSHYDRLWYGVKNNLNDTIGSDHAPHLKVNKEKTYPNSPSGMPGVQTLMPVMLNHVNDGKLTLSQLVKLVCENPVKIFGIQNKGFIKEDYDADFTVIDMHKTIEIKNENIESKCGWSPFHGFKFKGTPVSTIIGGKIKMKDGIILGEPEGKPLNFN